MGLPPYRYIFEDSEERVLNFEEIEDEDFNGGSPADADVDF